MKLIKEYDMEKNHSSVFRIDERVFFAMGFFSLLIFLFMMYSYKNGKEQEPVALSFNPIDYYPGSIISFKAEPKDGETYEWDFGDESDPRISGPSIDHAYDSPGNYRVKVTVNGKNESSAYVYVIIKEKSIPVKKGIKPTFICPGSALVNRTVTFEDTTQDATKWEWFFDQREIVNDTNRKTSWMFSKAGLKKVYLRINGKQDRVAMEEIMVNDTRAARPYKELTKDDDNRKGRNKLPGGKMELRDKPTIINDTTGKSGFHTANKPTSEKSVMGPGISSEEVNNFLYDVVENKKTAIDFLKNFRGNVNLAVTYNGRKMTFNQMCNEIEEVRRRRVKRFDIEMTLETGFITELNVKLIKTLL